MFAGSLFLSLTHVLDVEITRYLDPLSQRPHRLGPAGTNPTRIPVVHGDCWTGPPISLAGSTGPNLQPPPRLPKASTSRARGFATSPRAIVSLRRGGSFRLCRLTTPGGPAGC